MKRTVAIIAVLFLMVFVAGCKVAEVKDGGTAKIRSKETATQHSPETLQQTEQEAGVQETVPENTQTTQTEAAEEVVPTEEVVSTELSEIYCDEKQTLGFVACESGIGEIDLIIRNMGRDELNGVHIKYYDRVFDVIKEETRGFAFLIGQDKTLSIPVEEDTKKVELFPITGNSMCFNKGLAVIPETNCR